MAETFWPAVAPVVTEEAGTRGGEHAGIDLAAKRGDPVLAPFDGTVVYVGGDGASGRLWVGYWLYPNGEGRTVDIRRADGLISRVGHLDGYNVQAGQVVKAGDCVGFAGDSGYSTGVHIHWETRWDRTWVGGRWINPRLLNPQIFSTPEPTVLVEEEDDMSVYFEATGNSSPFKAGDDSTSRIWAGERKIGGVTMSSVWERTQDGSARRLFKGELDGLKAAYAAAGRKLAIAKVHGNVIEQLIYGKRG